jgi:hypothetical protein
MPALPSLGLPVGATNQPVGQHSRMPIAARMAVGGSALTESLVGGPCPRARLHPVEALADFVRCRDLTCRWPGCDHPATDCDVDHTPTPRAVRPTRPTSSATAARIVWSRSSTPGQVPSLKQITVDSFELSRFAGRYDLGLDQDFSSPI